MSRLSHRKPRLANRPGFALEATLIVMVLISALIFAAASGVIANQQTTTVDQGNTQALYVAEGGADAVMSQLSSYMSDGFLSDAELGSITPPSVPGWTYDPITATKVGVDSIRTITSGDFAGLVSYNQTINLRVHAYDVNNNRGDVIITANAQAVPVFQFGVFYDGDLEIHPGALMTFEGWVHTNSDLFVSSNTLHFMSLITTPDSINWQRKAYNERLNGVQIDNASGTPSLLSFDNRSTTPAQFIANSNTYFDGRVRTIAQGVAPLRLPLPTGVPPHTMIEPRVAADNNQIKGVKFANKADLLLRINMAAAGTAGSNMARHNQAGSICNSNGGFGSARGNPTNAAWSLSATWVRDSGSFSALPDSTTCKGIFKWNPTTSNASSPTQLPTMFRDGRENHKMTALDIDVGALKTWVDASWATRKVKVMYVEFYNVPAGTYPVVRVINAAHLPGVEPIPGSAQGSDYGFTLAAEVPIYVKGDFNYSGGSAATIAADWKPASLIGDAIIFLSPSWVDGPSTSSNGNNYGAGTMNELAAGGFNTGTGYAGSTMYVYAAIAAGHSPSPCDWQSAGCPGLTSSYGGGLENFPRFLEDWGGKTLFYRGSLVSLFDAQKNVGAWNGSPYSPPARDWRFDLRFQAPSNLPPGTPLVGTVMQLAFRPVY